MDPNSNAMDARLQEAWAKRQDAEEIILSWWKTFPVLRMLWGAYREARLAYREDASAWEDIVSQLPEKFQKRIAKARRKATDLKWFHYMEFPNIVKRMHAASVLAPVFDVSVWTKADRVTLAGCEDLQAVEIGWENLIIELKAASIPLSDEAKSFNWKHFDMTSVREIMRMVSLLLDSADSPG
jgi:hypothetical protein